MSSGTPEHLVKVLFLGQSGSGKTALIKRHVHSIFSDAYKSTVGVDFALHVLNWDDMTVRQQLWDLGGNEAYGSMTRVYFKEAKGVYLVCEDGVVESLAVMMTFWEKAVGTPGLEAAVILRNKTDKAGDIPPEQMKLFESKLTEALESFPPHIQPTVFKTSAKDNIGMEGCNEIPRLLFKKTAVVYTPYLLSKAVSSIFSSVSSNSISKLEDVANVRAKPPSEERYRDMVIVYLPQVATGGWKESSRRLSVALAKVVATLQKHDAPWLSVVPDWRRVLLIILGGESEVDLAVGMQEVLSNLYSLSSGLIVSVICNDHDDVVSQHVEAARRYLVEKVEAGGIRQHEVGKSSVKVASSQRTVHFGFREGHPVARVDVVQDVVQSVETVLFNNPKMVSIMQHDKNVHTYVDVSRGNLSYTLWAEKPGACEVYDSRGFTVPHTQSGLTLKQLFSSQGETVQLNSRLRVPYFLVYPINHHVGRCTLQGLEKPWEVYLTEQHAPALPLSFFRSESPLQHVDIRKMKIKGGVAVLGMEGSPWKVLMGWLDGTRQGPVEEGKSLVGEVAGLPLKGCDTDEDMKWLEDFGAVILVLGKDATESAKTAKICDTKLQQPLLVLAQDEPQEMSAPIASYFTTPDTRRAMYCDIASGEKIMEGLQWIAEAVKQ